jgi:anti-sigma factor RsiW
MTCGFADELPLLLYQGELEHEERERLRSHLATCELCSAAFADLEATAHALDMATIPPPSKKRWATLKADVLARVASAEKAEKAEKAEQPKVEAPATEPCGAFEEDLLCLAELEPARREAVLAHVVGCARCKETQAAFSTVGLELSRSPLEWPAVARWDGLKASVLAATKGAEAAAAPVTKAAPVTAKVRAKAPEPIKLLAVDPSPSVPWRFAPLVLRVAAVLFIFVLGGIVSQAFFGSSSPAHVREELAQANGSGSLAATIAGYENVVRDGIGKLECTGYVDEAMVQLHALHDYQRAAALKSPDDKRVALINIVAQNPTTKAATLAFKSYKDLVPSGGPVQKYPFNPRFRNGGFGPDPDNCQVVYDPETVHRYTQDLEGQYARLTDLQDEASRAKREELRLALAKQHLDEAQHAGADGELARNEFKRVQEVLADPTSPMYAVAQRGLESLREASGQ